MKTYSEFEYELTERENKDFKHFTEDSIKGIKYIDSLDNQYLLNCIENNNQMKKLIKLFPEETNSSWIKQRVFDKSYDLGIIDTTQFDELTNNN